MTNMPTYPRITQPLAREAKPDVATHEDIDWRKVSVAEAIDADRKRQLEQRAKLDALRAAKRKPGMWATVLQVVGVRRAS